uniref:WD repeat domain 27 n=1 Tax=Strigops habroptila TaxID=2489341 RepID=A0A672VC15_STRHB
MEGDRDGRSCGGSCDPDVVCEKQLFRSELSESLVQLACSHHHSAFPLNRNELCIWNTATAQPLLLSGHDYSISALSFGSKINPLCICSASRERVIVWNLDECTQKVQEEELKPGEGKSPLLDGRMSGILSWKKYFSNSCFPGLQSFYMMTPVRISCLQNEHGTTGFLGHITLLQNSCPWQSSVEV